MTLEVPESAITEDTVGDNRVLASPLEQVPERDIVTERVLADGVHGTYDASILSARRAWVWTINSTNFGPSHKEETMDHLMAPFHHSIPCAHEGTTTRWLLYLNGTDIAMG